MATPAQSTRSPLIPAWALGFVAFSFFTVSAGLVGITVLSIVIGNSVNHGDQYTGVEMSINVGQPKDDPGIVQQLHADLRGFQNMRRDMEKRGW